MNAEMSAERRIVENPFLVLGVAPEASRIEVEREAQKLLGMLELGLEAAAVYRTPFGPRRRTPELVRTAVATLRDPARRLVAELWAAGLGREAEGQGQGQGQGQGAAEWAQAMKVLGWSRD